MTLPLDDQNDEGEQHGVQTRQGSILQENGNDDKENSEDTNDLSSSDESEDEDSEDEDAEAIARKLGDQLWADIQRARAVVPPPIALTLKSPKEDAALATTKKVIAFAANDPLVHSTLSAATVPGHPHTNLLELLKKLLDDGRITPQVAGPLSQVLVKLAKSEVLFSPLPSLPSQVAKRKREGKNSADEPIPKRLAATNEPDSSQGPEKTSERTMEANATIMVNGNSGEGVEASPSM